MKTEQAELFGLIWRHPRESPRLRVNDIIQVQGRLGRVIRVNECAAVVLINRSPRAFKTRFDRQVSFQPAPTVFRISVNSETEILNRRKKSRRKLKTERRIA